MILCDATVDFDPELGIYFVNVRGNNAITEHYFVPSHEAFANKASHQDCEAYAAMNCIERFIKKYETAENPNEFQREPCEIIQFPQRASKKLDLENS